MSDSVLMFAEDTGAANFIADLPPALTARGVGCRLIATGQAARRFKALRQDFERLDDSMGAEPLLAGRPALVLAGTSTNQDTFGLKLIAAARAAGIETAAAIDAPQNLDVRFRGNSDDPLAHAPDWLLVPDPGSREACAELGFPAARIVLCGHPYFDRVRNAGRTLEAQDRATLRRRLFPGHAEPQKVVLFAAEPSKSVGGLKEFQRDGDYTLVGRGGHANRTCIVLEEMLDAIATLPSPAYTVLRPHPASGDEAMEELAPFIGEFDHVANEGPVSELIHAADLVAGLTSMVLVEAVLMGRPSLSVVPRACERDWQITIAAGLTPCVWRRDELRKILPGTLNDSATPSADAVRRALPEGAGERVADFVCRRIGRSAKAQTITADG